MNALEVFSSFEKAVELTKEANSGCTLTSTKRHLALSPKYIGRLRTGVSEILDTELGRFSESLFGVLLAYGNIKLLQSSGVIIDDSPFIHFDVKLDAVVFKPKIGSLLKCVVNEQASDHVGCLVHDWFNLSLLATRKELNGQRQLRLEPGYVVLVQVERLHAMNGMLAIEAKAPDDGSNIVLETVSKDTDSESNVDSILQPSLSDTRDGPDAATMTPGVETSSERRKKKKRQKVKREVDADSHQQSSCPEESSSSLQTGEETTSHKKSKKHKRMEITVESNESPTPNSSTEVAAGEETSHEKKKKKKHVKVKVEVDSNQESIHHDSESEFTQITTGGETSHQKKKKEKHVKTEVVVDPNHESIVDDSDKRAAQIMTGGETSHQKKKKEKHVKAEVVVDPNHESIVDDSYKGVAQIMSGGETSHKKKKKHGQIEAGVYLNQKSTRHDSECGFKPIMSGGETSHRKKKNRKNREDRAGVDSLQPLFTPNGSVAIKVEKEEEIPKKTAKKRQSVAEVVSTKPPLSPAKEFTKLKKKKRKDKEINTFVDSSRQPLFSDVPSPMTEGTVHKKVRKQKIHTCIKHESLIDSEYATLDTKEVRSPGDSFAVKTEPGTESGNISQSVLTAAGSNREVSRKSHKKLKRKAVDCDEHDDSVTNWSSKTKTKKQRSVMC